MVMKHGKVCDCSLAATTGTTRVPYWHGLPLWEVAWLLLVGLTILAILALTWATLSGKLPL